jgi:VIT1/CCC1 family predicted Fe2+/Mn2+ transporter
MAGKTIDEGLRQKLLLLQRSEITEHIIYGKLARSEKDRKNRKVLEHIAGDELSHYRTWKKYTGEDVEPSMLSVWKHHLISRAFGITFGIKLMENGERAAQGTYEALSARIPNARKIEREEEEHEKKIIGMLREERLSYVGSIVLGLNDALVELTGALAGFTLAFQDARLIAMAGLITGIAASLSMGASEYLSTRSEEGDSTKSPGKASVYTTIAYVFTVALLIAPFFLLPTPFLALAATLVSAMAVIFLFTFYISVAKDLNFRKRFIEMAAVSMGVAAVTFAIGYLITAVLGVPA